MSQYLTDGYYGETAATAPKSERIAFIQRTYLHLCVAVLAFVGLEALLIKSGIGDQFLATMAANRIAWIGLLVLFIGGGMFAQYLARSNSPPATQYMGLALYVGIEAIFFLPILTLCTKLGPQFSSIPLQAGILTLTVFGGLSAVVLVSKRDFSFLGYGLRILTFLALGLIVVSLFTPFTLGIWFSVAMIALACGFILYDTSNVLHHYDTRSHVAASLALFSSLAMLFYYIVRLMIWLAASGDN